VVYIAAGAVEILNSDRSEASSSWIDSLGLCCEFCLVFLEIFSIFHHQSISTTSLLSIFVCIFWRDTECCWLLGLETGQKLLFLGIGCPFPHPSGSVFHNFFFLIQKRVPFTDNDLCISNTNLSTTRTTECCL